VSDFHAEALQATASEGLAQCPYAAARAGFEPVTLQKKGAESANEPSRHKIALRPTSQLLNSLSESSEAFVTYAFVFLNP